MVSGGFASAYREVLPEFLMEEVFPRLGLAEYVGPIPAELQLVQMFAAAAVAGSKELEAARRLIGFLGSERAAAAIRNNGMEPAR